MLQGEKPETAAAFVAPGDPDRSLTALISRRRALTLQGLAAESLPGSGLTPDLTCLRSVVAGSGSLQTSWQRVRALPFR